MKKRVILFAVIFALFVFSGITVYADPIEESNYGYGSDNLSEWDDDWNKSSGKCGDKLNWVLDNSNGLLTINGWGEMWARTSGSDTFWNADAVKSVSFKGTVKSIGAGAFSGCTKLTYVSLPRSVKKIGEKAFYGCSSLKKVKLVNTADKMGANCFAGCGALSVVSFTGSKQDWLFLTENVKTGMGKSVKINYSSTVSVLSDPTNVKAYPKTLASFSVKAEGKGTLKYQWYYKKKGAAAWSVWNKHDTATTTAVTNETWNGMKLYCRIEDSENFVSSGICEITIVNGITILSQPSDVKVNNGGEASFTVKAQGGNLKYQWYFKKYGASQWSVWKGHTTATTKARANETWDGMQVYCAISDAAGVKSDTKPATIRIKGLPKVTGQPANLYLTAGDEAAFTVKAQGVGLKYQWYYKKPGADKWSVWKGHTTATTKAISNDTWNGMKVYCVVSDGLGGKATSKVAAVKLKGMPKITGQPSGVTVRSGEEATFTVKAQGGSLKYQWYIKKSGATKWSVWKGHTTATTKGSANNSWNGMKVYCVITDCYGRTASSTVATIKIKK